MSADLSAVAQQHEKHSSVDLTRLLRAVVTLIRVDSTPERSHGSGKCGLEKQEHKYRSSDQLFQVL